MATAGPTVLMAGFYYKSNCGESAPRPLEPLARYGSEGKQFSILAWRVPPQQFHQPHHFASGQWLAIFFAILQPVMAHTNFPPRRKRILLPALKDSAGVQDFAEHNTSVAQASLGVPSMTPHFSGALWRKSGAQKSLPASKDFGGRSSPMAHGMDGSLVKKGSGSP